MTLARRPRLISLRSSYCTLANVIRSATCAPDNSLSRYVSQRSLGVVPRRFDGSNAKPAHARESAARASGAEATNHGRTMLTCTWPPKMTPAATARKDALLSTDRPRSSALSTRWSISSLTRLKRFLRFCTTILSCCPLSCSLGAPSGATVFEALAGSVLDASIESASMGQKSQSSSCVTTALPMTYDEPDPEKKSWFSSAFGDRADMIDGFTSVESLGNIGS